MARRPLALVARQSSHDAHNHVGLDLQGAQHGFEGGDAEVGLVELELELLVAVDELGLGGEGVGLAVEGEVAGEVVAASMSKPLSRGDRDRGRDLPRHLSGVADAAARHSS